MSRKPILCVDFDGVIHSYTSPWTAPHEIHDDAVPGAIAWLWKAVDEFHVHIYSSRSKSEEARHAMVEWMFKQAEKEWPGDEDKPSILIASLTFSCEKPAAFLTIDDRALCFNGDWSTIDIEQLRNFKPWNKRDKVIIPNADEAAPRDDGTIRKAHYGEGKQPWDSIKDLGWGPHFAASNVIKYLRRSKDAEHSLASAKWYWNVLQSMMEADTTPSNSPINVWFQLTKELTVEELLRLRD